MSRRSYSKHKKCHDRPGGAFFSPSNCRECKKEESYTGGLYPPVCSECSLTKNICHICGEKVKE